MSPAAFPSGLSIAAALGLGLALSAPGAGCGVSKPAGPRAGAGGAAATTACLDRPHELPRPPGGTLPCELLPPGYSR